jgi:signal transduction histidine kinase
LGCTPFCLAQGNSNDIALLQKQLRQQAHTSDSSFAAFANLCVKNKDINTVINAYRDALDNGRKSMSMADLPFLKDAYALMDSTHLNENSFYICFYLSRLLIKFHLDNVTPLVYARRSAAIAEKLNSPCLTAKAYFAISSFYSNVKHDLYQTYENLNVIDSIMAKNNLSGIADCGVDANIGFSVLYFYLGDDNKSIDYINKSIAIAKQSGKAGRLFDLYTRRALFEEELAKYPLALRSLDTAHSYTKSITPLQLNNLRADSFNIYVKLNDVSRASSLEPQIDISQLDVANDEFYDYLYNLIKLEITQHKFDKAAENIDRYTAALKDWNLQRWKNAYEVKYLLSKAEGNTAGALVNYEIYARYNDSVHYQSQNYAVIGQQIKYQHLQKETKLALQISLLQKQSQLDRLYLWLTVGFLCMSLLFVLMGYVNYNKNKKFIARLTALNDQVSVQKRDLEKNIYEKDRILDIVAHDLRSPVSGIYALTDIMLVEKEGDAEGQKPLGIIKKASGNALSLINELMIYRTTTADDMVVSKVDLGDIAVEVVKLQQLSAKEKNQHIRLHLPEESLIITADGEKINRLLTNLVSNAIKFSAPWCSIHIFAEHKDHKVTIAVKDTGMGIPPALHARLFDMFSPSRRQGTGGEKSYGLGLSICKQIAEAHGGKIYFHSEENIGTTFYVELPMLVQD